MFFSTRGEGSFTGAKLLDASYPSQSVVLLCLLITVLTWELEIKLGGQNLQWKIF